MGSKIFFCLPVRRNFRHFCFNFSILAEGNVSNSNAPSQNLFLHFVTTRFNMSSADAAKMLKMMPSLGRLKTLDNVEQLAYMLNRHGCAEDQIAKIIRTQPSLMRVSAERLLEPKIQLLKDLGAERENIPKIVTMSPNILGSKLETLRTNLEFLKTISPTNDFLVRAIMRNPKILCSSLQKVLKPSVAFWEGLGFCGIELIKFLLFNPRVLTLSSLTHEQLDLIRKIGIQKESKMYKYVVSIVARSRIDVLKAKIDNLQLCGLSPEEAWELVRADSSVLTKSEESVKKKMDFMLNHMGLSVEFVAKHPRMFSMSLDKVMRPRFLVLQSMTAMNGTEEVHPSRLYTVLMMNEAKFVAQIIERHLESAALWTVYKNAIANVSESSKIKRFSVS
ncbi:hypothetical protein SUGI_0650770 [Cryptomeria japonica]|uniref:transcription termination factor MTERF6, chloroplastic/mitochondrial-like n=1 Tax=Cryptomeria japonica TaxID=3369 RepID=UPI0024148FD4|nr:transcription termination factor MTERF6, chloroplastic/mitochondrial-like [Cryptomeria japonica]GLJ32338.1 hypothetical protein SUGI_0650770 [Cryptomeria japonica]